VDVSPARKTYDPQIFSVKVLPGRTPTHDATARSDAGARPPSAAVRPPAQQDLQELQRLIRVLERHAPVGRADARRDLEVVGQPHLMGNAEPHLRAVNALLVTLATYQKNVGRRRTTSRGPRPTLGPATVTLVPSRNGRSVDNGAPVDHNDQQPRGARSRGTRGGPASPDENLAAAAARYIARDLAARQLTEFTSAEGYRLARALAKLGDVEAPVEQLLREASKVRLHPLPLADAVSHSPH
jgi:hypothetical protein